jgi:hypothetical protein
MTRKQFRLVRDNHPNTACYERTIGLLDNEYFQSGAGNAQYFAELEAVYHNSSIVVPLTYNDPGQDGNFVNGTVWDLASPAATCFTYILSGRSRYIWVCIQGLATCRNPSDHFSLDSYPQGFDCSHPRAWKPVVTNYYEYHEGLVPFLHMIDCIRSLYP